MKVVRPHPLAVPDVLGSIRLVDLSLLENPIEHPPAIVGVVLSIPARGHIEQDAALTLLLLSRPSGLQSELRLADPCRSHDNCQRLRHQPAAEKFVESGDTGGDTLWWCRGVTLAAKVKFEP